MKKVLVALTIGVAAIGLSACESQSDYDDRHKPYVEITPSGDEILCTWTRGSGFNDYAQWKCEKIDEHKPVSP